MTWNGRLPYGGEVKTREDLSSCRSQIGKYGGLKKRKKRKREGKKGRREKQEQKQKQVIYCTPH